MMQFINHIRIALQAISPGYCHTNVLFEVEARMHHHPSSQPSIVLFGPRTGADEPPSQATPQGFVLSIAEAYVKRIIDPCVRAINSVLNSCMTRTNDAMILMRSYTLGRHTAHIDQSHGSQSIQ